MALVSTIIPVFNRPRLLREAVESVIAQTHRPIETIIVDDGSDDRETPKAIGELVDKNANYIRAIRIINSGPGAARQTGLELASGAFIQFLDSDDLLEPRKFELQLTALAENPSCDIAYGQTRQYTIGEEPNDLPIRRTGEFIETMFPAHLKERWWSTSTPLFRRAILDAVGPWSNLRNEEDWEYECRIAALGVKLTYVDAIVSSKREHQSQQLSDNGSTDQAKLKDRAEAHRLILNHARNAGIPEAAPEMRHFARELFLLARQCGAAGVAEDSRQLFRLARDASTPDRANSLDFRLYRLVAGIAGWKTAGSLAQYFDRFRQRHTRKTTEDIRGRA